MRSYFLHFLFATISLSSSDNLKYHLINDFPGIKFHQPLMANESLIVTAADPPVRSIIDEVSYESNPAEFTSSNDESSSVGYSTSLSAAHTSDIYHTGSYLKNEINRSNLDRTTPWPPKHYDLTIEKCLSTIPPILFNHIAIMTGCVDTTDSSPERASTSFFRVNDQVRGKLVSICQDIMYLESKGQNPTPKSLALGITVRHLSGSKHLGQLLSGLGHTASYETTLRVETALAAEKDDNKAELPAGFRKHGLTVLVYDNLDFNEATLTGSGTTHIVNGIMIQLKSETQPNIDLISSTTRNTTRAGARSFKPPITLHDTVYISETHGPLSLEVSAAESEIANQKLAKSMYRDLVFTFLKSLPRDPLLPGWTDYNIRQTPALPQSSIHYLLVIDAPAPGMSTVKRILDDAVQHADSLECDQIIVVFDQAIYSKAQTIRWQNPVYMERLVLRLGEFHTVMCFLSAIGKRFNLSGLIIK